jgi:hypothetical protein
MHAVDITIIVHLCLHAYINLAGKIGPDSLKTIRAYFFSLFILYKQMFMIFNIMFVVHCYLFGMFKFLFVKIIICSCC